MKKNNEKKQKELYQYKDILVYVDWEKRIISVEKGATRQIGLEVPKPKVSENLILDCLEPSDL